MRTYTYDAAKCEDPRDNELGPDTRRDRSDAPWLRKGPLPVACPSCGLYAHRDSGCEGEKR